uniref:Uncharacterized protein n=1 Tax=Pelusios castaneus TaxID=367368 RepID=A0A8C8VKS2_9SAUR
KHTIRPHLQNKPPITVCPICLEYFTDPVVLDCDHNFCRVCITQCWEGSQTLSCPQCRQTCPEKNLRPNRQLRNIVEAARGLRLQSEREAETEGLCEKHKDPLKLFCKDDQIPICLVCNRSKEHRDHRFGVRCPECVAPITTPGRRKHTKFYLRSQAGTRRQARLKSCAPALSCSDSYIAYFSTFPLLCVKISYPPPLLWVTVRFRGHVICLCFLELGDLIW